MKHLLFFVVLPALLLAGCQKEADMDTGPNLPPGQTGDGPLLNRIVFQYNASDSAFTDFWYNRNGKWMGSKTSDKNPVLNDYVQTKVYRLPSGEAYRYVTYLKDAPAGDSSVYRIHADKLTGQYLSKVKLDAASGTPHDSISFTYQNNRIVGAKLFMRSFEAAPYTEEARAEFSYSGKNCLMGLRNYKRQAGQNGDWELASDVSFGYDGENNPVYLGMEAIVLDQIFFIAPNNITRIIFKNLANSGAPDEVMDFSYQYHNSKKPASARLSAGSNPVFMYYRYW